MSLLDLDFTNVETKKRIPQGTHRVSIISAEDKVASSGNKMLAITYKNANDEVAYDNFVILPQSMWKLKMFLEAVFQAPFTSSVRLDPRNLVGKSLIIKTEDEDYINNNGESATRTRVLSEYAPLQVGDMVGVAPVVPQAPAQPVAPVVPSTPRNAAVEAPVTPAPQTPQTPQTPQVSQTPTTPQTPSRPKLPWE